ncbi:hypothetical protein FB451DRAFT_1048761 [Mycena latifolia]|nr:hypothetical protein FB451DRAFT_1048761 [Mycena latifolia]
MPALVNSPPADVLYARDKLPSAACRAGCAAIEDQHHIFVECARYADWREKAREDLVTRMNNKLEEKGIEEAKHSGLLSIAKSLFVDDSSVWPLHYSTYFLGHIPKFDHTMPTKVGEDGERLARMRLTHHIASEWHTACIRLAGRIWGDWQRDMAKKNDTRGR